MSFAVENLQRQHLTRLLQEPIHRCKFRRRRRMLRQPEAAWAKLHARADPLAAAGAHQINLLHPGGELAPDYVVPAMPAGNAEAENRAKRSAKHNSPFRRNTLPGPFHARAEPGWKVVPNRIPPAGGGK